ncbi:unnamed protein product, partial [Meganyctiphanes norvegica]
LVFLCVLGAGSLEAVSAVHSNRGWGRAPGHHNGWLLIPVNGVGGFPSSTGTGSVRPPTGGGGYPSTIGTGNFRPPTGAGGYPTSTGGGGFPVTAGTGGLRPGSGGGGSAPPPREFAAIVYASGFPNVGIGPQGLHAGDRPVNNGGQAGFRGEGSAGGLGRPGGVGVHG